MSVRLVLVLFLAALPLLAQARPRAERLGPQGGGLRGGALAGPRRERIMARLHEVRMQRLQRSLGIDEDRARAIADRWARFDDESVTRHQRIATLRQDMNATLMGPGTEEEKNTRLQPQVDQLARLRQQQQEARRRFEDEVRGTLTPAQQGRFLFLVEEMQRNLQDAIQGLRRGPQP